MCQDVGSAWAVCHVCHTKARRAKARADELWVDWYVGMLPVSTSIAFLGLRIPEDPCYPFIWHYCWMGGSILAATFDFSLVA